MCQYSRVYDCNNQGNPTESGVCDCDVAEGTAEVNWEEDDCSVCPAGSYVIAHLCSGEWKGDLCQYHNDMCSGREIIDEDGNCNCPLTNASSSCECPSGWGEYQNECIDMDDFGTMKRMPSGCENRPLDGDSFYMVGLYRSRWPNIDEFEPFL